MVNISCDVFAEISLNFSALLSFYWVLFITQSDTSNKQKYKKDY